MVYEIFKTLNNLNPVFMKDIFHYSPNVTHEKHNLYIHTQNTTKFGNKSLRAFGANIWNTLPEYIKLTTSFLEFKKFIKTWPRPKCKCSVCKWEWNFLLNMIFRYARHFAKMNSEHCQASEVELFEEGHNLMFLEALHLRDWIIILPAEDIVNQRRI